MPAAEHNITIEQGETFIQPFLFRVTDGDPIDISELQEIRMQARDPAGTVKFEATIANEKFEVSEEDDGVFTLTITPAQSLAIDPGSFEYDLFLVWSPTNAKRLLYGRFEVTAAITRD